MSIANTNTPIPPPIARIVQGLARKAASGVFEEGPGVFVKNSVIGDAFPSFAVRDDRPQMVSNVFKNE